MRVRRLRWLQAVMKFPIEHELPVESRFGNMQREADCAVAAALTLDDRADQSANPWAKLFEADACSLLGASGC
eukprot:983565-Pyramimonas_sp.AAC.1